MHAKWRNIGWFLIDFLDLLPIETRNSCLSEATSVTTFKVVPHYAPVRQDSLNALVPQWII